MKQYIIKRTKEGYVLGYKDIVGLANSFKEFVEQNKNNLSDANLSCVDLSNCNLSCVDLSNCNLSDANLSDANLSDANIYTYSFLKTSDIFEECFLGIGCKTKKIKDWNIFFYDSDEELETKRDANKFIEITKEYEETIKIFKQRFDKGELK